MTCTTINSWQGLKGMLTRGQVDAQAELGVNQVVLVSLYISINNS